MFLLIIAAAVIVQCLTGFGFGIFAAALLPLCMPLRTSAAVLALLSMALNFFLGFQLRRYIRPRKILPVALACMATQAWGRNFCFRPPKRR